MSIDDEDLGGESVTENRQLEWFTDRYEFTRLFASYLNDDPPRQNILYFYGDGGNGKSLLLKYLRTFACKRFSQQVWQQVKAMSDRQVAEYIRNAKADNSCTTIPAVWHDFGLPPIKEDQPQHPFFGLLMLRRNIAAASPKFKFKFPLFDFACFWYLLNKGESPETLQKLFPDDVVNLLTPVIESVAEFPVVAQGVAILKLIDKIGGKERLVKLVRERLGISKEQAEEICRKDIDIELIDCLPKLLAEELKAAMARNDKNKPERLVLFFDTHEKFWDGRRESQGEKFFYLDEWVRRLLRALPLELGIVVVMAGRDCPIEQLRWCDAGKVPIPQQYLDTQLVWHLSKSDAKDYLQKAEITEADLVEALIKYASVNPEETDLQVHPFYIGLCADVVLLERKRGKTLQAADFANIPKLEDKTEELINRLLRYVDKEVRYAVHSLSACRTFNDELYFKLGDECRFQATAANFDILKSFSFVWQDKRRGTNSYRIHDLLRRLDDESENTTTRKAHKALETHYREVGNLPEAIYHANRLDWRRGVDEWVEVFDAVLQKSNYQLCSSLLEVRGELRIASDFQLGRISQYEGDYFSRLARHAEAKLEYLEAVAAYNRELSLTPDDTATLNEKGLALRSLGDLQAQLSEFAAAKQSYTDAIDSCNSALLLAPDYIQILNNKGSALQRLGNLQAQLTEFYAAKQSYKDAIASYNSALLLAPDDNSILNSKGIALKNLGYLQAQLTEFTGAKQSYTDAIASYNSALLLAPDDSRWLNNKGSALRSLGDLQAKLSEFDAAKQSYTDAISSFNSALLLAPDYINALNNKGLALQSLGDLQAKLIEFAGAKQSYKDAIASYNSALLLAPDFISALNHKGVVLQRLGDLQAQLSEFDAAKQSYTDAISSFNAALLLAPDYVDALNNKGIALQNLGDLQAQLTEFAGAKQSYTDAISSFNAALLLAPDDSRWLNNKGIALQSLGDLQAQLSEFDAAKQSYTDAIASYNSALLRAPNYINAFNNKGSALRSLGDLQAQLAEFDAAKQSYTDAIASYNSALFLAPDYIPVLYNKGIALKSLGDLQAQLAEFDAAKESYTDAISSYNSDLLVALDDTYALNNQGLALISLANLQVELSQEQEAVESLQAALVAFDRSLALDPNNNSIRDRRDRLQEFLDNL